MKNMHISKLLSALCIFVFVLTISQISTYANEITILFEHRTTTPVSRGVAFERNRMVTDRGMLDVHVITIDLSEPYIQVAPVTGSQDLGHKDTTLNMLRDAGALAGINADFFGMAGTHSNHFGPMAQDGVLLGASTYTNHSRYDFATFFLDANNRAFFDYITTDIRFYNAGRQNIEISTYNSVGNTLEWPIIVDRLVMDDTSSLVRRFSGLTKIVVNGNMIIQVSQPGEVVDVPLNGFVVVLPERMASRRRYFNVGEVARLHITNSLSINFDNIQAAIGGGAVILSDGELVTGRGVAPNARHPRSAIGVSRDGRRLFLMTVDGRSHSVGATHAELGFLLARHGAHNAMHFDGGGSTTMVTGYRGGNLTVANTVSDGSQRRVINALGVFDRSEMGAVQGISLNMAAGRVIVGLPAVANVFGVDELYNREVIDTAGVVFATGDNGTWANGMYTPHVPGRHRLRATYGEHTITQTIFAYRIAELIPSRNSINIFAGQGAALQFSALTTCGTSLQVPTVESLSVTPANLGHFVGNEFIATQGGMGYITAVVAGVYAYIPVTVGGFPVAVAMPFLQVEPLASPARNFANTSRVVQEGREFIRLDYRFENASTTQAAYVVFNPPIELPGTPTGLSLQVFGDGSGHWMRARVQDATGRNHLIDFTRNADFIEWETVIARLPNAPAPFTLDQIYMVSLSSYYESSHIVHIYGLQALYAPSGRVNVPENTRFVDSQRTDTGFALMAGGEVTSFNVPAAGASITYSAGTHGDFAVIRMTAEGNSLHAADMHQWRRFIRDIRAQDREHVVILMNHNPLTLAQQMEFELFHMALMDMVTEGRTVFVVSATGAVGSGAALTMRDGIRYINLPASEDAEIHFWVGGNNILWSAVR